MTAGSGGVGRPVSPGSGRSEGEWHTRPPGRAGRISRPPGQGISASSTPRGPWSASHAWATSGPARPWVAAIGVCGERCFPLARGRWTGGGHGDCPMGPLQADLGDPVPLFELVLPPRCGEGRGPGPGVDHRRRASVAVCRAPSDAGVAFGPGARLLRERLLELRALRGTCSAPDSARTSSNWQLDLPPDHFAT